MRRRRPSARTPPAIAQPMRKSPLFLYVLQDLITLLVTSSPGLSRVVVPVSSP